MSEALSDPAGRMVPPDQRAGAFPGVPQQGAARYIEKEKGSEKMKLAVTAENGQVFQHFGHTKLFQVFTVEEGKVTAREALDTSMSGHEALAVILKNAGVSVLICGGIGGGAKAALQSNGIELVAGASGEIEAVVEDYLAGRLVHNPLVQCSHHHHEGEGGHRCGHHHE